MSKSLNKAQVIGHIGKDINVRYTSNGLAVTSFSIATNEYQGEGKEERKEWHHVVAWQHLAEICAEYLSTGQQVYVEGRLQTSSWEDEHGQKRYKIEIIAKDVIFLSKTKSAKLTPSSSEQKPYSPDDPDNNDIPF